MIEGPGLGLRYREDEVTRRQVRPGTARRVWPYLRPYRGPMVALVLITAVDSVIVVVIPLILRLIIDDGILGHRERVVVTLALAVAGLALAGAGAGYVRAWYSDWVGASLVLELRASVFRHVLRQPLAFFTRTQTGALVSRLEDINETQRAVRLLTSESLSVLLNLVLVLGCTGHSSRPRRHYGRSRGRPRSHGGARPPKTTASSRALALFPATTTTISPRPG